MSHDAYDRLGESPDVCQGEHLVHILETGSFSPIFSLTPDQATRFADRVSRAAGRVREEHARGQVRREERDAHRHLLERPSLTREDVDRKVAEDRVLIARARRWDRAIEYAVWAGTAVIIVLVVWAFITRVTA